MRAATVETLRRVVGGMTRGLYIGGLRASSEWRCAAPMCARALARDAEPAANAAAHAMLTWRNADAALAPHARTHPHAARGRRAARHVAVVRGLGARPTARRALEPQRRADRLAHLDRSARLRRRHRGDRD